MIYSVDKIENGVAALVGDDGDMVFVGADRFGFEIKERDILIYDKVMETYTLDKIARRTRESENKKRLEKLFRR